MPDFENIQCKIQSPVMLSEGKIESASDFINFFFEHFLFFRWSFFKNRPRGNLLLIRAFLIVALYSFIFYYFFYDFGLVLEGIEIDPMLAFAGAIVVGYWNMVNVFHRKSESCTKMYIEMIKLHGNGQSTTAKLISIALTRELLTLDLWAHRMFRSLFARNLYCALEHAYSLKESKHETLGLLPAIDQMIAQINNGKLQVKTARNLLDIYHDHLLYNSN